MEAATKTVTDNAQTVTQNTQIVASNTASASASAESAKTFADNAAQSAKSVEDASEQIEQNKKDVDSLKEDIIKLENPLFDFIKAEPTTEIRGKFISGEIGEVITEIENTDYRFLKIDVSKTRKVQVTYFKRDFIQRFFYRCK